jgi:hypothetical protein
LANLKIFAVTASSKANMGKLNIPQNKKYTYAMFKLWSLLHRNRNVAFQKRHQTLRKAGF